MKAFTSVRAWVFLASFLFLATHFNTSVHAAAGNGSSSNAPASSATPPSGGSTDQAGINTDNLAASILSFEAQQNIGEDIAAQIHTRCPKHKIYIVTDLINPTASLFLYKSLVKQLDDLQSSYNAVIVDFNGKPGVAINGFWPANLADAVTAASQLLALATTSTTTAGVTVTTNELAVIPALANQLQGGGETAVYVNLYADPSYVTVANSLLSKISTVNALRMMSQVLTNQNPLMVPGAGAGRNGPRISDSKLS